MVFSQLERGLIISTPATCALKWQKLDNIYIVYQPSSSETHVFNETTALILKCLEDGPLSTEAARQKTVVALGVGEDGLIVDEFVFATMRLEELGLIEHLGGVCTVQ